MIDLAKVTRIAMNSGLDVTHHHKDVPISYVPEIPLDELVEVFNIQKPALGGIGFDNGLQCIIIKRSNDEVFIIGCLESTRFKNAWRFLNKEDYTFYVNELLPKYNIHTVNSYVRTPINSANDDLQEFYFYTKVEFPSLVTEEIEDGILISSIGDMVYDISTYRGLVDSHYDQVLNKWYPNVAEVLNLNGSRCNVLEIKNEVIWLNHVVFNMGFAYFNGRVYVPITNLNKGDNLRHFITPAEVEQNEKTMAPFIEYLEKVGLQINLTIFNESEWGPSKDIADMLCSKLYGDKLPKFDLLVVEITPITYSRNISIMLAYYFNLASSDAYVKLPVAVHRDYRIPKANSIVKEVVKKIKPIEPDDNVDLSGFYLTSIKSS